jgi:GTPase SAR1 family protein
MNERAPLQKDSKGQAYIMRILVVGATSCGTTSLIVRFDQNTFSFRHNSCEDYREKAMMFPSRSNSRSGISDDEFMRIRVQLWDTRRGERHVFFQHGKSNLLARMDGLVLCYDTCNTASFNYIAGWIRDYYANSNSNNNNNNINNNQVILLCGTKSDRIADRMIATQQGSALAEEFGIQFYETSSFTGANVEDLFTVTKTTILRCRGLIGIDDAARIENSDDSLYEERND